LCPRSCSSHLPLPTADHWCLVIDPQDHRGIQICRSISMMAPRKSNLFIAADIHLERILEKTFWFFMLIGRSNWWIVYVLSLTLRTSKYQDSSLRTYRGI
jgi:hypothetical protein